MVNNELCRCERVDLGGVTTEFGNCFTHGGKVNYTGNTGEVLHDDTSRSELDLSVGLSRRNPATQGLDLLSGDISAILSAKKVLKENLEAVGQLVVSLN